MNWEQLTEISQLAKIDEESKACKVLIFKHSTRCSISHSALDKLERKWQEELDAQIKPYFLDLLKHRDISNAIAERYGVTHHSPQVLIIVNGNCVFSQTHSGIVLQDILDA